MAGTRLAAQAAYCISALLLWLVAWQQGAIVRKPLPLHAIKGLSTDTQLIGVTVQIVVLDTEDSSNQVLSVLATVSKEAAMDIFQTAALDHAAHEHGVQYHDVQVASMPASALPDYSSNRELDTMLYGLQATSHSEQTLTIYAGCSLGSQYGFTMGQCRHGWLSLDCNSQQDAAIATTTVLPALASVITKHVLTPTQSLDEMLDEPRTAYRMTFTLLNQTPADRLCKWNFGNLSQRYLTPMLQRLSQLATVAVHSQEIGYGSLTNTPPNKGTDKGKHSSCINSVCSSAYANGCCSFFTHTALLLIHLGRILLDTK
jgi:Phosphatidylinositol-glycan biosynthesis class S protein